MPPTSASRPTAVVTGGAAGLGLAVAMQLRATHRVVLLARDPRRGARGRDLVGGDSTLVVGDLGSVLDDESGRCSAARALPAHRRARAQRRRLAESPRADRGRARAVVRHEPPGSVPAQLAARRAAAGERRARGWESPEDGARPVVRLASAPVWADRTGRYVEVDREVAPAGAAGGPALGQALWEQAARLTGVVLPA